MRFLRSFMVACYLINCRERSSPILGCGTGEMTLRLADAGYDMIAVDASDEMLSILSGKLAERETTGVFAAAE